MSNSVTERDMYKFNNLSYEERLKRKNITSLKDKRVRRDLIEIYKVIRGLYEIELNKDPD